MGQKQQLFSIDVVWLVFPAKTTFNDIISEEIEFITDNRRWENLKDMVKE